MRIAIVGASGALGGEVLAALDETRLPIETLVPIATERSVGIDVEFRGESIPIETELAKLRGADLAFLCAPPAATLEAVRAALRASVPAIDCSGTLAANPDVPLVSELGTATSPPLDVPLVALPTGAALACARVLAPLGRALELRRVIATLLESASGAGRAGVQALSEETIALLSQQESPEPAALGHPVAFDVLPWIGEIDDSGVTTSEHGLRAVLARALGPEVGLAVTILRIPVFCGEGITVAAEFAEPVSLARIIELLAKIEGLDLGLPAPTTRAAAGSDEVFVGRVRRDPSCERGALLWLATDGLALTATHAVRVAEARFRRV